ncbi:unnamed protein product [Urochloa humidicola]
MRLLLRRIVVGHDPRPLPRAQAALFPAAAGRAQVELCGAGTHGQGLPSPIPSAPSSSSSSSGRKVVGGAGPRTDLFFPVPSARRRRRRRPHTGEAASLDLR